MNFLEEKQSQNILNWYPFDKDEEILEIGLSSNELTKMLCSKVKNVTIFETDENKISEIEQNNLSNLNILNKLNEKTYDTILLIGAISRLKDLFNENLSLKKIIKKLELNLKEQGKFIIAVDNKFGLRYFAGNPENIYNKRFESLYGYNNETEKTESFTRKKLVDIFDNLEYKYNFYYPLPDYKMPDIIFSDKQLAKYNTVDKYNLYCPENSITLFNEIDVFREILKTNPEMFTFFTNAFLIELSKNEIKQKYNFISFNNIRKEQYQLITKIADDYVEKQVISNKAEKHYDNIKQNIDILNKLEIKTLDYVENGIIKSKYVNQELMLSNILTQKLENGKLDEFEFIMSRYIETLNKDAYNIDNYDDTIFAKYDIKISDNGILKKLHFLKNGLWDMTFKNCFYIDNEFYFFDQEWNDADLPIEYILYRSILYTISLRRYINIDTLFEKYNLMKYIKTFKELDDKIQEKIKDAETWKFYNKNNLIDIDATINEIKNTHIRENAKDLAIENYKKQIELLTKENENLINSKLSTKIKRYFKKSNN